MEHQSAKFIVENLAHIMSLEGGKERSTQQPRQNGYGCDKPKDAATRQIHLPFMGQGRVVLQSAISLV